jgi:hypothetical protein
LHDLDRREGGEVCVLDHDGTLSELGDEPRDPFA